MVVEVRLPPLAKGDEATVAEIKVEEGEPVVRDDPLVEVQAGSESFDVYAPRNGVIREILVEENDVIAVGDVICTIEED